MSAEGVALKQRGGPGAVSAGWSARRRRERHLGFLASRQGWLHDRGQERSTHRAASIMPLALDDIKGPFASFQSEGASGGPLRKLTQRFRCAGESPRSNRPARRRWENTDFQRVLAVQ